MGTRYHPGERAVQERAELADQAAFSDGAIRAEIPDVAVAFLAERTSLAAGAVDGDGDPWCTLLGGPPGFLRVTGPRTLEVDALPGAGDPLDGTLGRAPARIGLLAIDPATRRRMRINGVAHPRPGGLRVTTDQVYSNCPKYIQKRVPHPVPADRRSAPATGARLTPEQRDLVGSADTFFIATAAPGGDADASHRGGAPGFVRVHSPTRLSWPDYVGNAMFNTLGNLWERPRAGLLFPDWETGSVLQLTGAARIRWDGTDRTVEFEVERTVSTPGAGLLSPGTPLYSKFNPPVTPASPNGALR
ncbi:pyridoxamine 5'-phosphate oxidase family protein [Nocardiopsis sp. CC223A]|uniref:pyridoxamine 5'-phosphate oxidase family protein n=1 Tax=Nocardiopsis sp. CC223A TaxID=3044051 RepID=UPI00278C22B4|nr:pyridoxamine 5'-phosphate oxidase family protein [Nocardiopsis sp. CC223A]